MIQTIFKINMKAKARLLLILICMVSFTGFGTTTDLRQNSDCVTIENCFAVNNVVADFVVVKSDFRTNELKGISFSQLLSKELFHYYLNANLNLEANLKEKLIPPLNFFLDSSINSQLHKLNLKTLLSRLARDGINCNLS